MEQPNTDYINQLAGDNQEFKSKVIAILKKELPEEIESYKTCIDNSNFIIAAEFVHKLKHKISFLGLEKSYYIAEEFEENLKNESKHLQPEFEAILMQMINFVINL